MNKREFITLVDKYYCKYDLKEIRVSIWTGQSSSFEYCDSWISIDCYNKDGDFIQEIDDYLKDIYCDIPDIKNVDKSTLEERQNLMKEQQKMVTKIRKWVKNYDITVKKCHANV